MDRDKIKMVLRKARALIDTSERWTQGIIAENIGGVVSRCASGAIEAVMLDDLYLDHEYEIVLDYLLETVESDNPGTIFCNVPDWNDAPERTHKEVMQAFDRSIDDLS